MMPVLSNFLVIKQEKVLFEGSKKKRDFIFMGNYISYWQKYFTCGKWVSDYVIDTHFF